MRAAFSGICVMSILVFSQLSQAAELPCTKQVKSHKERDLGKLRTAVESAVSSGSESQITKLAACDFMLGKPESHVGGFRNGKSVAPEIAKLLKNYKFNLKGEDYKTQVNVGSASPTKGFELVYRKDDSSGWYWAGLSIADSIVFDKLIQGSYQIQSNASE